MAAFVLTISRVFEIGPEVAIEAIQNCLTVFMDFIDDRVFPHPDLLWRFPWGYTTQVDHIRNPRKCDGSGFEYARFRKVLLARAEGDKQSRINRSEGLRAEMINKSEGEKQKRIDEAEGRAAEIRALAEAAAASIAKLAAAINEQGGSDAVRLQLTERYLSEIAQIAKRETDVVLAADLTNMHALLANAGLAAKTE